MRLLAALKASLLDCAGDVVFGVSDGTVSIFGLVFGVASTSADRRSVLIAGCTAAAAAAVSMMAGVYLEAKTDIDVGVRAASPVARSLWMLVADFLAAAAPIVPFVWLPVGEARWTSLVITLSLLALVGWCRATLGDRRVLPTVVETSLVAIVAAAAGVGIGLLVDRCLT